MSNRKILFRIPFTVYFLAWDKDVKKFLLAVRAYYAGKSFFQFIH